jgi:glycosyltransferase involved in cell wall biosynthesis
MIEGKKLVIVLPAYNAELTFRKTYAEIPFDIVDEVVLVDDNSSDRTVAVAHELGSPHYQTRQEPRLWRQPEELL